MKRAALVIACIVSAAAASSTVLPLPRLLVWNVTASVPRGLYLVHPADMLRTGDRVAIMPPPDLAAFMAERGYLASGTPLIKRVAALHGDTVCRSGLALTINDRHVGFARGTDSAGRALPGWQGCHRLGSDELFAMGSTVSTSFDGRYFGVLPRSSVLGRAIPIWTTQASGLRSMPLHPLQVPPHWHNNQGDER